MIDTVATGPMHVHILIDNFCQVSTMPTSATVPVMILTDQDRPGRCPPALIAEWLSLHVVG